MDMGADTSVCDDPGLSELLIRLAPGVYNISDLSLVHNVSLEGAGEEETVIEGTVRGLGTGATLSHVTVRGEGTGIHVEGGESPEILNCTITTGNSGPGVSCRASSPVLTNCTITGNSAPGGGVRCYDSSAPVLTNCTITENPGGGVNCMGSSPVLTNCTITGNSAHDGAGLSCYDSSSPVLTNCTITGNSARWGGGVDCSNSSPVLTSCIVWSNVGGSVYFSGSSNPQISFSCIEGGWPGVGNIDADPLFADPNNGDYHLKSQTGRWDPNSQSWVEDVVTSPCVDAGDPRICAWEEPNPSACIVDMGAYGGTTEASKSLALVPECFPTTYSTYNDWITLGSPCCWCWQYHCDGDTDCGRETLFEYRIYSKDLGLIVDNWKRKIDDPQLDPCADIDHKSEMFFNYRVYGKDLAMVVANWKKKDADLVGDCPRPE
jgi:parallel beta-helix repeat protein